jgi:hypothetical protein
MGLATTAELIPIGSARTACRRFARSGVSHRRVRCRAEVAALAGTLAAPLWPGRRQALAVQDPNPRRERRTTSSRQALDLCEPRLGTHAHRSRQGRTPARGRVFPGGATAHSGDRPQGAEVCDWLTPGHRVRPLKYRVPCAKVDRIETAPRQRKTHGGPGAVSCRGVAHRSAQGWGARVFGRRAHGRRDQHRFRKACTRPWTLPTGRAAVGLRGSPLPGPSLSKRFALNPGLVTPLGRAHVLLHAEDDPVDPH